MSLTVIAWDPYKADCNERVHGVGFDEATAAFLDASALLLPDTDNAGEEERFVLLGAGVPLRLPVVCHGYREREHVMRITAARRATQREAALYELAVARATAASVPASQLLPAFAGCSEIAVRCASRISSSAEPSAWRRRERHM